MLTSLCRQNTALQVDHCPAFSRLARILLITIVLSEAYSSANGTKRNLTLILILEDELSLFILVFVLSSSSVLTTFSCTTVSDYKCLCVLIYVLLEMDTFVLWHGVCGYPVLINGEFFFLG